MRINKTYRYRIAFAVISTLIITGLILWDHFYGNRSLFEEGRPDFSSKALARSAIIACTMFLMVKSITYKAKLQLELVEGRDFRLAMWTIVVVGVLTTGILIQFIANPSIFSTQSLEDGPVEWASAWFLFLSSFTLILALIRGFHFKSLPKLKKVFLLLFASLFFVMGMEEVSWFQRVLEFDTPELFSGNSQSEFNLHNFSTNLTENLYYFGAFVFLIVLPFIRFVFPKQLKRFGVLRLFVGRPFIIPIGAIACAYNYDMWNIVFTQIAFFGTLFILLTMMMGKGSKSQHLIILGSAIIFLITQLVFLNSGKNYARIWEVTEYKEFLIPLAFFIYSIDVFARTKNHMVEVHISK